MIIVSISQTYCIQQMVTTEDIPSVMEFLDEIQSVSTDLATFFIYTRETYFHIIQVVSVFYPLFVLFKIDQKTTKGNSMLKVVPGAFNPVRLQQVYFEEKTPTFLVCCSQIRKSN